MAERSNKLILDTKEMTEGFFEDTRLLGIMAPLKDYQFCWHLNNSIGLNFRLNSDLEIPLLRKGRNYFFTVYEYNEPTRFLSHYLYNTKFDGEYLLPEFRHLDFLWLMKGDAVADETMQETIHAIKSFNGVQLVTEIPIEQVKNKENLVF
ncbi:MAG TPA: IPExxxVDY family protein [Chitinophagaceae bacterium]|nr:IPExxxVDY family protein [Chitinophagaceae bacterium]HRF17845.1 IPExxxVDY family protein [Chitinophagaceae bacterium]